MITEATDKMFCGTYFPFVQFFFVFNPVKQTFIVFLFFTCRIGLDLYEGTVRDNKKAGVLEPTLSKIKSLKFATEAAITILRIDDMIKLAPEPKERDPHDDCY